MARRVVAGNRLRLRHEVTFEGRRPLNVHLDNLHLHRTFNNGRFDQGGRFYGGFWQRLPKTDRSRLLIDGERTVELDYAAFQPRLCFDLDGVALGPETDPYALCGLEMPLYRDAAKKAFGQLVNAAPDADIGRAGASKTLFPDAPTYREFIARVEVSLAPIAAWLRAGRGLELQFIDSQIADRVIFELTEVGVPCLPIHDSFIVPASAQDTLEGVMVEAYSCELLSRTGTKAQPVIRGPEARECLQGS